MDKNQILTAALVAVLVAGVAVYRLLWTGSSSAAAAGLRRFPKSPGKLLKWFLGRQEDLKNDHPQPDDPTRPSGKS
jgi:cytochrome b